MSKYDKHVVGVFESNLKLQGANFIGGLGVFILFCTIIIAATDDHLSFFQALLKCWIGIGFGVALIWINLALHKQMKKTKSDEPIDIVETKPISTADELTKLHQLKEKGILTEKEFQEQKNRLLSK